MNLKNALELRGCTSCNFLPRGSLTLLFLLMLQLGFGQDCIDAPVLSTDADLICDQASVDLDMYDTNNPGIHPSSNQQQVLIWSTNPTPTLDILESSEVTESGTYYAWYFSEGDFGDQYYCPWPAALASTTIEITFATTPSITTADAGPVLCDSGSTTISVTTDSGSALVEWFDSETDGNSLGTGDELDINDLTETTSFWAEVSENGCLNPVRTEVVVVVNETPLLTDSSGDERCGPGVVNLTASANPGDATINWYDQASGGDPVFSGTDFSPDLSDTTSYYVSAEKDGCESERTEVIATILPIPELSNPQDDTLCDSGTADLSVAVSPSGATVNWYSTATGNDLVFTGTDYSPNVSSTTTYYVEATLDGCTTASRTEVTVTVNPVPEVDDTSGDERCGSGEVTLTATTSSPGAVLNWYDNESGGSAEFTGETFTADINSTTTFYVAAEADGCESARQAVTATVNEVPEITNTVGDERCGEGNVTLTATVSPSNATISWYDQPSGGSSLGTGSSFTVSVAETTTFYAGATLDGCSSGDREAVVAQVDNPASAGVTTNASACSDPDFGETELDLDDLISGETPGDWDFTDGPETVNPNGQNLVDFEDREQGTYTYTYTAEGEGSCPDVTSTLTITITDCDPCVAGNTAPQLDTDTPTEFCDEISVSLNDFTNTTPPEGTVLAWSKDPETLALLDDDEVQNPGAGTFFGFFYDGVNDCRSPTLEITLSLNNTPSLPSVSPVVICDGGEVTLVAAPGADGEDPVFRWYDTATSSQVLEEGNSFTTTVGATRNFFVEAVDGNCISDRVVVAATVNVSPSAGTPNNTAACNVPENGPSLIDLDDRLNGADAGEWTITTDPSGNLTLGSGNTVNFNNSPDGQYVFTFTTTGAQAPCTNDSVEVVITVNDCDVDTDGDGLFDGAEASLGTDSTNPDTDGDGLNDGVEVGDDVENPLDEDGDGIIDALESNSQDEDGDGVADQSDPANEDPCIPDNTNALCDTDGDGITDGDEIANGSDPLDACDPNLTPDCDPDPIDLQVSKEVNIQAPAFGQEVVFTVGLDNLSDSEAKSIIVGELLEPGFEYVSHVSSAGNYDPVTGEWTLAELDALGTATLEITVTVIENGTYSNTAELLQSFPDDDNTSNNSATVTLELELPEGVDLRLHKKAESANPLVGEEVLFTIGVENVSEETEIRDIVVDEPVASLEGFEFIDVSFASAGAFDPETGQWTIPALARGEEALLGIWVRVPLVGIFTNTASLQRSIPSDGNPDNNQASATVRVSERTNEDPGFLFNQFSPNGDGTNDLLRINAIGDYPENSLKIFNRYGNLVFEAQNMTEPEVWDGRREGKEVPDGTYFYILDLGAEEGVKKGWIQLIR